MRRNTSDIITVIVALTLAGCGIGINNSTVLDAAQTFTQAQNNGDSKVITEIDHSQALLYPPQTVLDGALSEGYSKHKIDELKFEQVEDTTVKVIPPNDAKIWQGRLSTNILKRKRKVGDIVLITTGENHVDAI